jgi:3-dehydroquinate synthase
MGRISATDTERQLLLLSALGLPTAVPDADHNDLIAAMQKDKKVAHGRLRFILPTKIGHVELVSDVDEELVRAAMKAT